MSKRKEEWNWFPIRPGYWCEILYTAKSVGLKLHTTKHDLYTFITFSPAIAQRVGKALIRAALAAEKIARIEKKK
jgi:hypothetical protein